MPKIEVDEDEWNRSQQMLGVARKIAANPKARRQFEAAHKLVDPNALTPITDQEEAQLAPVNAIKSELAAEIAALKKEREDEKRDRTLSAIADRQNAAISQLRRSGYTDEGVAAVQKLMEDKGLLDVDDAVAIFEKANPPQIPVTPGGIGSWGFTDMSGDADKSIQDLIASKGNSEQIADRMARDALTEFRQAGGRR